MSDILDETEFNDNLTAFGIPALFDDATRAGAGRLLRAHDAALRARLAEVEADRDRWHAAYEEEVEVGGARLVEAVELLRTPYEDPYSNVGSEWRDRARAFIDKEEQGQ